MMVQLSLFDFVSGGFCEDEAINEIVDVIEESVNKVIDKLPKINSRKRSYEVWEHVPKYGKRLEVVYTFDCQFQTDRELMLGIGEDNIIKLLEADKIIEFGAERGIEISITPSPNMLFLFTVWKSKLTSRRSEI